MKITVLSIRQPWAELILLGKKTIELRTWNMNHRGEFYIHAGYNINVEKCKELELDPKTLFRGAVLGKSRVLEVKRYETREELIRDESKHFAADYKLPCYGFILGKAERIKPVELKGQLGFFKAELLDS